MFFWGVIPSMNISIRVSVKRKYRTCKFENRSYYTDIIIWLLDHVATLNILNV